MNLRPYQAEALDALNAYFETNGGNPLVVIPTAGGKSLIISEFARRAVGDWPDTRVLILTHVRELISQNFAEMVGIWPEAPAGIYSAGIGLRQIGAQILFAGIQSIHRRAYDLQRVDLVLIDEAHLIPRAANTMYRRFLSDLLAINPYLKIVGFTATHYRLDSGMLHRGDGALFTDVAYEVSVRELIERGYLSPVISKATATQLDVTGVATRGGEFVPGDLERAIDRMSVTTAAVREIVAYGEERRSWLVFGAGIKHCTHIAEAIADKGYSCATIFGDTPKAERDRIIADYKAQKIRCLVSMGVLTTGFNAPAVDLLAMLRPTKSTGLYVQIVGRGTRLAPGKQNCLVLDFSGNVKRHGPIDDVKVRQKGEGEGDAPVKVCPSCETIVHASVRECPECGHEFPPPEIKVSATADIAPILSTGAAEWMRVDGMSCRLHLGRSGIPTLRVTYRCGLVSHHEYLCLEHTGFPREKAAKWWAKRAPGVPVPDTVAAAVQVADALSVPREIAVRPDGKFFKVVGAKF